MVSPALHIHESERQKCLESYHILGTEEVHFDKFTEFVANHFGVKYCLITILDKDKQWFKSHFGTDITETDRAISFCAHTILTESGLMVAEDLSKDIRFFDNPMVADGPKVRFYCGQVLKGEEGLPLGTLCILDDSPRTFSKKELSELKLLSDQVMNMIELNRSKKTLKSALKKNSRVQSERLFLKNRLKTEIRTQLQSIEDIILNVLSNELITKELTAELNDLNNRFKNFKSEMERAQYYLELGKYASKENESLASIIDSALSSVETGNSNIKIHVEEDTVPCSLEHLKLVFKEITSYLLSLEENQDLTIDSKPNGNELVISLRCSRGGMNRTQQNLLFPRFIQEFVGENCDFNLAICQKIVELHSGKIWVYSAQGAGITIYLSLPRVSKSSPN